MISQTKVSINNQIVSEIITRILEIKNLKNHREFMKIHESGRTLNGYISPYKFMKNQLIKYPKLLKQTAMIQGKMVSYEEMLRVVNHISQFLHTTLRVKKGENISICALSSIAGIEAFFAMNKLGIVNARIFNGTQENVMRENLVKFESKTIFTDKENFPIVCMASKETTLENVIILSSKFDIDTKCNLNVYFLEDIVSSPLIDDYEEEVTPDDLASILYTSGSSGTPKPIAVSNKVYVNMVELTRNTTNTKLNDGERVVGVVSHEYPYAAINSTLMILLMGKTLIMPENMPSGEISFNDIMLMKPHRIQAIPNFYKLMQSYIENKPDCNLKFLKNVISGGETYTIAEKLSLCNSLKQVNNKAFIIDGFGFGEMGSATALKFGLSKYFLLMNGVEAMAVNPTTNQPLPLDKEGVLCITGPTLTDGYYKDSDSTKKSYIYDKNGKRWFKSDTYGAVHGRYRRLISLGGRVREYFITGDGHGNFLKVYSGKVESVILENANVKDCIVVPSDDSALPTPVAYYSLHNISKENGNDIIKSIIESCNSLEEFCRPTAYYYETEIKRTKAYKKDYMYYKDLQRNRASNKIDYQKLEEKYREKNETL